jgi:hypothetical protein
MSKIVGPDAGQVSIDIGKTKALVCKCGNHTFEQISFLRVLPALLSPNGKDAVIPMMSFACNSCGAVPDQVIPPFIRDEALRRTDEPTQAIEEDKPKLSLV